MVPILFVSLEKGKLAKVSYYSIVLRGVSISTNYFCLPLRKYPTDSANLTKAISSGLEA